MHRPSLTVVALVAVAAGGLYATAPETRAQEFQNLPFSIGETVISGFPPGGSRECVVNEVSGTFVKCGEVPMTDTRFNRPTKEYWYNLQTISDITRTIRR